VSRPSEIRREPAKIPPQAAQAEESSPYFFVLLILFAGSGCAALIYEVVWLQLLQLVIGASAVSLGLLLAAYMGGLCLGSLFFSRFIATRHHPIKILAIIELSTAVFAVLALFLIPLVGRVYASIGLGGFAGIVLRGAVAAACLLPPTVLMGATLPAISRFVTPARNGLSQLGFLYSANVAGAVFGSLLAGFYLLRVYDMGVATYTGAAINLAVAAGAFFSAKAPWKPGETADEGGARANGALFIYIAIALSGLTALGAEVVWTRLLSLLLGATVYTFSIILAVFLGGLWLGSSAGSLLVRRIEDPRVALAGCQILLGVAIAWTAFTLAGILPYWPVDPALAVNPWFVFDLDLTRTLRAILPATLCWGASFPLALASVAGKERDPARFSGELYSINTAGSIVGALAFSLILIPSMGTRGAEQLLIWLAGAAAIAASMSAWPQRMLPIVGSAAGALVLSLTLASSVPVFPWEAMAYGRRSGSIFHSLHGSGGDSAPHALFAGEGVNSTVVIVERGSQRFFYVSGKSEASSGVLDMRLQRMMGHLPALIQGAPQSVLVVGFGAGVTSGSFVPYHEVKDITICELEPIIPPASGQYFAKENHNVISDPRVHIVYDDARHYISAAREKFDVITTDPIHPWVKGASTLYSKEYFEMVKAHLNPGGVVAQWLPLYESNEETVKSQLATFFQVFPHTTVWSNYLDGDGYDLVLLGRENDAPIDVDTLDRRLRDSAYAAVSASLADAEFHNVQDLLASYAGRASDLAPFAAGGEVNEDLNLRLQYLAGLGINSEDAARTYARIMSYRGFPSDLLTGTGDSVAALRKLIQKPTKVF
jgi:spermidine synthase